MPTVTPFLMFDGQAEAAMNFYIASLPDARIEKLVKFGPEAGPIAGKILAGEISICGRRYKFFDSPGKHEFTFTPAISQFVECASAAEVDAIVAKLSVGGKFHMPLDTYDFSKRFAWFDDKFGVSWQIILV